MAEAPSFPAFTRDERDRRWTTLRTNMADAGVDMLVVLPHDAFMGDVLFVANRVGAVVFPREGEPTLFLRRAEPADPGSWISAVQSGPPGLLFAPYGELVANHLAAVHADGRCIAVAGLRGGTYTLVRQPEGIVLYTAVQRIQTAVPNSKIVDGTSILGEARYPKSDEEVGILRESVRIAEASAAALQAHAVPGATEASVYAVMMQAQAERGAFPHVAWQGTSWGTPARRTVGPPPQVIHSGWVINNEIEPGVRGYTAQIDQPLFVGPAPALAAELFELGKKAFEHACQVMCPGATWGDVIDQVEALAAGTEYRLQWLAHGRGLGDEGPLLIPGDVPEALRRDRVRARAALVVKPYAYVPGQPAQYNVTWGDTVLVTGSGARRLGTRPHALIST
jgi:Xaa-Pro aminopeptidase